MMVVEMGCEVVVTAWVVDVVVVSTVVSFVVVPSVGTSPGVTVSVVTAVEAVVDVVVSSISEEKTPFCIFFRGPQAVKHRHRANKRAIFFTITTPMSNRFL